jgi:cytochrome c553
MKRKHAVAFVALAFAGTPHGWAAEPDLKKLETPCAGCHGAPGAKPPFPGAPRLDGQQYEYVVAALRAFRGGERESAVMGAMAKALSDAEIRALANDYAARPGLYTKY